MTLPSEPFDAFRASGSIGVVRGGASALPT
jgi:hypothetical protein